MAESIVVLRPDVTGATFAANPVNINTQVVLRVTVVDQYVTLEAEQLYSGEFYAGEMD